jgi:hypothetical protein
VRESTLPQFFCTHWADIGLALPGGLTSWLHCKRRGTTGTDGSSITASATPSGSADTRGQRLADRERPPSPFLHLLPGGGLRSAHHLSGRLPGRAEEPTDDRDDEIARLRAKAGEMTMDDELLIQQCGAGYPFVPRGRRPSRLSLHLRRAAVRSGPPLQPLGPCPLDVRLPAPSGDRSHRTTGVPGAQ